MTRQEWNQIAVVLDYGWPGDFDEAASASYYALLKDQTTRRVEVGLQRLVDSGARFRPSPSEIMQAAGRGNQSRKDLFTANMTYYTNRYGLAKAVELLDPKRELEAWYPKELSA